MSFKKIALLALIQIIIISHLGGNVCFALNSKKPPFKYIMNTVYPWSWAGRNINNFQKWISENKKAGVNVIRLAAPWNLIEPKKGIYEFDWLSKRLNIIKSNGLQIQLILDTFDGPPWILDDADNFQRDENNHLIRVNIGKVRSSFLKSREIMPAVPSFYNAGYWSQVISFYKAVCQYVNNEKINVIAFNSAWDVFLESEYVPFAWGGYEAPGREKFILWLKSKYKNLASLNDAWGTKFIDWDQIDMPRQVTKRCEAIGCRTFFADWLSFRTVTLKGVYDKLSRAIKGVNKDYLYGVQWGSSGFYRNGPRRGTVSLSYLSKGIDWIFSGAQGEDPHRFVDGVLRCSIDRQTEISREIDAPYPLNRSGTYSNYLEQINEAGKWFDSIDFANWDNQKAYNMMVKKNLLSKLLGSISSEDNKCTAYDKKNINVFDLFINFENYNGAMEKLLEYQNNYKKSETCMCYCF